MKPQQWVTFLWSGTHLLKTRTDPLNLASFLSRLEAVILQAHSKIFQLLLLLSTQNVAIHRQCLCLCWVHFHFSALAHILREQLHPSLQREQNKPELSMSACERQATVVLSHWTPGVKVLHTHWYILPPRLIYNFTKYEFINCNIVIPMSVNIQKNNTFVNTCLAP